MGIEKYWKHWMITLFTENIITPSFSNKSKNTQSWHSRSSIVHVIHHYRKFTTLTNRNDSMCIVKTKNLNCHDLLREQTYFRSICFWSWYVEKMKKLGGHTVIYMFVFGCCPIAGERLFGLRKSFGQYMYATQ